MASAARARDVDMALVTIENNSDVTDTSCFEHFQHFIGRSINRTVLTVEGAMAGELLDGANKTGMFTKITMALYLKRYHRESLKRLNMRKAVLREMWLSVSTAVASVAGHQKVAVDVEQKVLFWDPKRD